jgi:hypothetical protein
MELLASHVLAHQGRCDGVLIAAWKEGSIVTI